MNLITQRVTPTGEWDEGELRYELLGRFDDEDVAIAEGEKIAARTRRFPAQGLECFVRVSDTVDRLYDEDISCAE